MSIVESIFRFSSAARDKGLVCHAEEQGRVFTEGLHVGLANCLLGGSQSVSQSDSRSALAGNEKLMMVVQ